MAKDQLSFLDSDEKLNSWSSLLDTPAAPPTQSATVVVEEEETVEETSNEPEVFSVSQLNALIRSRLEGEFSGIWIRAEISNFKAHTSGHFYFSLKDEKSQISAVMFKGLNAKLKFKPDNGMEVLVYGKVTVYEPRGNYQIFCESMEPVGEGALQKAFEQLKNKLQAEGLFDLKNKKKLPEFPKNIGIVTSPTGAVIRDILHVLARRNNLPEITLIPVRVQGDTAAAEVVKAIELANKINRFDVLIVGRGGGSLEDLWSFNEEIVARAIFKSKIPIISAVGHEVDYTIADFVADIRAPTPSAAAEIVIKSKEELLERVFNAQSRILRRFKSVLDSTQERLRNLNRHLVDPKRKLQDLILRCDELYERFSLSWVKRIQTHKLSIELAISKLQSPEQLINKHFDHVDHLKQKMNIFCIESLQRKKQKINEKMLILDSLSPLRVLERGFSVVKKQNEIITDVSNLSVGQSIDVELSRGSFKAKIESINLAKE